VRRRGAALPLALVALLTVALLAALVLDASLGAVRRAQGDVAELRAQAAVESALADLLQARLDSAATSRPRGSVLLSLASVGRDSARAVIQSLGGSLARVVVRVRARAEGARADAGVIGLVRLEPDSGARPLGLRVRRLPGPWWVPVP
jgi:membrane-bound ClpP family serine protease